MMNGMMDRMVYRAVMLVVHGMMNGIVHLGKRGSRHQ